MGQKLHATQGEGWSGYLDPGASGTNGMDAGTFFAGFSEFTRVELLLHKIFDATYKRAAYKANLADGV